MFQISKSFLGVIDMMISIWNFFTELKNINIWLRYSCLKINKEYIDLAKKTLAADSSETLNITKKLLLYIKYAYFYQLSNGENRIKIG